MTLNEWFDVIKYVSTLLILWGMFTKIPSKSDIANSIAPLQTQITILAGKVTALDCSLSVHMAECGNEGEKKP